MSLPFRALGRVAVAQSSPQRYIERRDEEVHYNEDRRCRVSVRQQLVLPRHAGETVGPHRLLVPIGYFTKRFIADLNVYDDTGRELAVLNRKDRGRAIALLFTSGWQRVFLDGLNDADTSRARVFWRLIQHHTALVATEEEDGAAVHIERVLDVARRWASNGALSAVLRDRCRTLFQDPALVSGLNRLASTRLILAESEGYLDRPIIVRLEFSEPFELEKRARGLQRLLVWLGWEPIRISRSVANYGQAASLWITQRVPRGVEPIRSFWSDEINDPKSPEHQSLEQDRVVANHYPTTPLPPDSRPPALRLDVQLSPSPAFVSTWALAAVLLFVSTYVYQTPGLFEDLTAGGTAQQNFVGLAGAFAAVPAALAGALAYNGEAFARLMARGPRQLLAWLSAIAALLAVIVGLRREPKLIAVVAYVLSVYSFALIGVFAYLQWGPRWRKGATSRWKTVTEPLAPARCRRNQHVTAIVCLVAWIGLTVVFARSQYMLRYTHFLTHEFPGNVWRAFWSWFGLAHYGRMPPS